MIGCTSENITQVNTFYKKIFPKRNFHSAIAANQIFQITRPLSEDYMPLKELPPIYKYNLARGKTQQVLQQERGNVACSRQV